MKVAITGGICTGKTHIGSILKNMGFKVIDADAISRQVAGKKEKQIAGCFKDRCLSGDGNIDRKKLAQIIFNSEPDRRALEKILHPEIISAIGREMDRCRNERKKFVVIAPLIYEAGLENMFDKIVLVSCPEELQIERVAVRDKIGRDDALKIIRAQLSGAEKSARADYIIDTSKNKGETEKQVKRIFNELFKEDVNGQGN
ncbi:MAG: dephospho-CoA kinase [Candidatus Aureabacteria bacterium]|nr:dephospho-CoA kinase [Candidatus Auribacterota bacterium]